MKKTWALFTVLAASAILAGCASLTSSSTSSASQGSSASSQAGAGLVAYTQVRTRTQRALARDNPRRRPSSLNSVADYPFNNAIPFIPRNAGEYVSSDFGWRNLWGRLDFHCGVDVVANTGTPILAVTDGTVTLSRNAGSRGGVVMEIDGRQYTYWHMRPDSWVKEGTQVRAGQRIGRLANWGNNTHIHYAVYLTGENTSPNAREDVKCVDPMELAREGLF